MNICRTICPSYRQNKFVTINTRLIPPQTLHTIRINKPLQTTSNTNYILDYLHQLSSQTRSQHTVENYPLIGVTLGIISDMQDHRENERPRTGEYEQRRQ